MGILWGEMGRAPCRGVVLATVCLAALLCCTHCAPITESDADAVVPEAASLRQVSPGLKHGKVSKQDLEAAKAAAKEVEHADAPAPEEDAKAKAAEEAEHAAKATKAQEAKPPPIGKAKPIGTFTSEWSKPVISAGKYTGVLPTLPASCKVEVAYVEAAIPAAGTIGQAFQLTHSGLTFTVSACDEAAQAGQFTLQYYAHHFPAALVPKHGLGEWGLLEELQWDDEASVFYAPGIDFRYWTQTVNLGSITGDLFNNKFSPWVVEFGKSHSHYQLWDVWNSPTFGPKTKVWMQSTVCDSFPQDGIAALQKFGGSVACDDCKRNYAPLVTKTHPVPVDMKDPAQKHDVWRFYTALTTMLADANSQDEGALQDEIQHTILAGNVLAGDFFVHDGATGVYWRVKLETPEEFLDLTKSVRAKMMLPKPS